MAKTEHDISPYLQRPLRSYAECLRDLEAARRREPRITPPLHEFKQESREGVPAAMMSAGCTERGRS